MLKRVMWTAIVAVVLGLVPGNPWSLAASPRQESRSVHVAVVNNDGTPITDLTAADFEVKEGGKTVTVNEAAISNVPMRIALIVADEATGSFQQSMVTLIKPLIAIAEFKLISNNYSAEYSHALGGVTSFTMKSGGNELHGSAFHFLRNDKLDARSFFSAGKSPVRQNEWGGTVGGPMILSSSGKPDGLQAYGSVVLTLRKAETAAGFYGAGHPRYPRGRRA